MAQTDPDLLIALARYHRAMNGERTEIAQRVKAIFERHTSGHDRLDALTYATIQRDLDGLFHEFYGAWPTDPRARFLRMINDQRRRAFAQPFARDAQDVTRRLRRFPEVLRALREEAA